ncbi:D-glucuronyl C5-epimerase B-like isoform X1 [Antedon mediterranea]|uniref:D-glucuronyl C5-epimerase B-like isoform X1 n=2 Tax=Antedon mediterranea TaxID=105859 RepID=UPI003AF82804
MGVKQETYLEEGLQKNKISDAAMRCSRFSPKNLLVIVTACGLMTVLLHFYQRCDGEILELKRKQDTSDRLPLNALPDDRNLFQLSDLSGSKHYKDIECLINDDITIQGRREGDEVYLPFSFIQKYFDITGKIAEYDGFERFEWQHSYARVYQEKPYDPNGVFMSFSHYNVEQRDRVKMVCGVEGVPMTTQWDPSGYFYPIQISQFGLSHFSKNLTEKEPRVKIYEDGETNTRNWVPDKESKVERVFDAEKKSNVLKFETKGTNQARGPSLSLNVKGDYVLTFDLKVVNNVTITVSVETVERERPIHLHYASQSAPIQMKGSHITYNIGENQSWRTINRDLVADIRKGIALTKSKQNKKINIRKIIKIILHGNGYLDNFKISSSNHMENFYASADWLLRNQDMNGGWPIMVNRKLDEDLKVLPPGWYSAMAQGHAISVLTRAFTATHKRKYIEAALHATKLYTIPSTEGGVKARFLDTYNWYEEYPTTPSSFVLNGFIYSLIGLYDLKMTASQEEGRDASQLYNDGLRSLKAMLMMYDTGSGSIYDLRHMVLGKAPNLARWDYHATHCQQLMLLASIEKEPIFDVTSKRWMSYMKGKRAKHN